MAGRSLLQKAVDILPGDTPEVAAEAGDGAGRVEAAAAGGGDGLQRRVFKRRGGGRNRRIRHGKNQPERISGRERVPRPRHRRGKGPGWPSDVHRLFHHGPQREQPQPRLRPGAGARRHLHHGCRPGQARGPQPHHL